MAACEARNVRCTWLFPWCFPLHDAVARLKLLHALLRLQDVGRPTEVLVYDGRLEKDHELALLRRALGVAEQDARNRHVACSRNLGFFVVGRITHQAADDDDLPIPR